MMQRKSGSSSRGLLSKPEHWSRGEKRGVLALFTRPRVVVLSVIMLLAGGFAGEGQLCLGKVTNRAPTVSHLDFATTLLWSLPRTSSSCWWGTDELHAQVSTSGQLHTWTVVRTGLYCSALLLPHQ